MKKTKFIFIIVFLILTNLGCSKINSVDIVKNEKNAIRIADQIDAQIKANLGFTKIEENSEIALFVNGTTAEFYVQDLKTGNNWYSNPQDRMEDALASNHNKFLLGSQLSVEYIDKTNKKFYLNTAENSIESGNYFFSKIENGVRITYDMSDGTKTFVVPKIIRKDRLEKFLLSMSVEDKTYIEERYELQTIKNVNEEMRKLLISTYPSIVNSDIYVLVGDMPDFVMTRINTKLELAGYKPEDLQTDNEMNFIAPPVESVKISVAMEIVVDMNSVTVNIPQKEIIGSENVRFTKMDVLPFFGAGGLKDEGYMFIPDGCGTIINFNNGKKQYDAIKVPVYGNDLAIEKKTQLVKQQQAYLPVFGINKKTNGLFAMIESGESLAVINADISGRFNSYNFTYPTFDLIKYSSIELPYGDYDPVEIFAKNSLSTDLKVRYAVLNGENSGYSGMARYYRHHLEKNKLIKQNNIVKGSTLNIELIGAVDNTRSVFGVPVKGNVALTKYSEVETVIKAFQQKSIKNISLKYTAWGNDGKRNSVNNSIKTIKQLGTNSDFVKMIESIKQMGISLFFDVDFLGVGKDDYFDSFYPERDAARNLTNDIMHVYNYDLATKDRILKSGKTLVKPSKISYFLDGYLEEYEQFGIKGISASSLGTDLYSDFYLSQNTNRNDSQGFIDEQFKKIKDNGYEIFSSGANLYSLKYLSLVDNVPEQSSGYYITDYDVPFYQMIIGDNIQYFSTPVNISSDNIKSKLKTFEYGSSPSLLLTFSPNSALKDTEYDFYSTNYSNWISFTTNLYNEIDAEFSKIESRRIINHTREQENCYRTTYGDGTSVYVNYNDYEVVADNIILPSKSYKVVKGSVK